MIGQEHIQLTLDNLFKSDNFPHFMILVGERGSGKKLLVQESIYPNMISKYRVPDIKVDNIRDMITMAYKQRNTLFFIPDADNMSGAAQNSLLKVVEECPNNNYFIMTLQNATNTLPTILSRASIYHMDIYTREEKLTYYKQISADKEESIVVDICETPGEVEMLVKYDISEFWQYTQKVVDNIALVSGANCFKIAEKVSLKDEGEGYDLRFFWKAFANICMYNALNKNELRYLDGIRITSQSLSSLGIKGINRQMLFDTWILKIRKAWMEWM